MKNIENLKLSEKEKAFADVALVCLLFAGTVLTVAGVFSLIIKLIEVL